VASLLRLKDNHCHLEEAERVLIKNRKLTGARKPDWVNITSRINTKRPTIVFFLVPTKLLKSYG
jgi:hypothetical protein